MYIYQTNLQSANMTLTVLCTAIDRPGPPPSKRSRLDPSASGASTAGPSAAIGLDTKLSEWKPKVLYNYYHDKYYRYQ